MKESIEELVKKLELDEHIIPMKELCERLKTNAEMGLSPVAAKQKLRTEGPNLMKPRSSVPEWLRFSRNMFAWFNILLWIGSFLCIIAYVIENYYFNEGPDTDNLYLGFSLACVVFISGCFSYYREARGEYNMASFRDMIPRTVIVIRSGSKLRIPAEQLVAGDLVVIRCGDRVPADLRLTQSLGLQIDNSLISEDPIPVSKFAGNIHTNPLETGNLLFFGTNVVEGTAHGIVVRTGDRTITSRKAMMTENTVNFESLLSEDISDFIRIIAQVSIFTGILLSSISYLIGYTWLNAIIFGIALIVAQVPEGLFPTVIVCLTLTAKRMAAKNCLVKNLQAVETLGSTSIICTDKTGTLTQNRMIVSHIWCNSSIIDSDNLFRHADGRKADLESPAWKSLIRIGCLCNRAEFSAAQARLPPLKREAIGDATEVAILKYMEIITGCVETYRIKYPKIFEIPFNSRNKYSMTINKFIGGHWLCMKGAPEIILNKCSTILTKGEELELDDSMRQKFSNVYEELGILGERVIGLCDKFLPLDEYPDNYPFDSDSENYPTKNLRFIGLISMIDPPRPSVPDAVLKCRKAGIKIIMITGDHPITAKSIARAVGIISEHNQTREEIAVRFGIDIEKVDNHLARAAVFEENQIKELSNEQLAEIINSHNEIVFARTSPQQKLRIVECCRRQGSIVAVTGDTTNDTPALKKADISISMGIVGSDISKQAADIILLDDNFSSIVIGIEEGRVIFDNLKKSICYTLSSKTPEMSPFIFFLLFDIPLALGAITILCIDLGTDMIPAISLAYEGSENIIMNRKPRDPKKDRLVTFRLISMAYGQLGAFQMIAGFFTYLVIMSENGFLPSRLYKLSSYWDSKTINDLSDSYGQEWTYHQRKILEHTCHTAFFASVVITRWSALVCCKTRKLSIFQHGMKNDVLTFAMFFELGLAIFLSYCPGLDNGMNMYPLKFLWWFCGVPFALFLFCYEELRKLLIRQFPNCWLENETYY